MADQDNGTLSDLALSTPPNVLSSKSSDISIEELGMEESDAIEAQLELNSDKVPEDAAKSSEDTDNKSSHVEGSDTKEDKETTENGGGFSMAPEPLVIRNHGYRRKFLVIVFSEHCFVTSEAPNGFPELSSIPPKSEK